MAEFFLFIGVSMSSIYLWDSGLPQVSHVFLAFVAAAGILKLKIRIEVLYLIFIFFFWSSIVNFYYLINGFGYGFAVASAQIAYNFILFVGLSSFLIQKVDRLRLIVYSIVIGYSLQVFVYAFGYGNWSWMPRYAGTFNDPNQMAYWFLATTAIVLMTFKKNYSNNFIAIYVCSCCSWFVYLTMSRSGLFAIVALVFLMFFYYFFRAIRLRRLILMLVGLILLPVAMFLKGAVDSSYEEMDLINRVVNLEVSNQIDERGYTRFVEYPEYLLFGSGHGAHYRFNQGKGAGFIDAEVHSTWAGLAHYYGIIGLAIIILFIRRIVFCLSGADKIIIYATFVYGLFTYSFRTPIFWILLSVAYSLYIFKFNKEK